MCINAVHCYELLVVLSLLEIKLFVSMNDYNECRKNLYCMIVINNYVHEGFSNVSSAWRKRKFSSFIVTMANWKGNLQNHKDESLLDPVSYILVPFYGLVSLHPLLKQWMLWVVVQTTAVHEDSSYHEVSSGRQHCLGREKCYISA